MKKRNGTLKPVVDKPAKGRFGGCSVTVESSAPSREKICGDVLGAFQSIKAIRSNRRISPGGYHYWNVTCPLHDPSDTGTARLTFKKNKWLFHCVYRCGEHSHENKLQMLATALGLKVSDFFSS